MTHLNNPIIPQSRGITNGKLCLNIVSLDMNLSRLSNDYKLMLRLWYVEICQVD